MNKNTITIMKGQFKVILPRNQLIEAEQTHEGIVFLFTNGCHLYVTDVNMPVSTKERIKIASNSFPDADLFINLDNYSQPASAEL